MTLLEQNNQKIPEYYDTMYMDGFTPEEILMARRRAMFQEIEMRKEEAEPDVEISSEVQIR